MLMECEERTESDAVRGRVYPITRTGYRDLLIERIQALQEVSAEGSRIACREPGPSADEVLAELERAVDAAIADYDDSQAFRVRRDRLFRGVGAGVVAPENDVRLAYVADELTRMTAQFDALFPSPEEREERQDEMCVDPEAYHLLIARKDALLSIVRLVPAAAFAGLVAKARSLITIVTIEDTDDEYDLVMNFACDVLRVMGGEKAEPVGKHWHAG